MLPNISGYIFLISFVKRFSFRNVLVSGCHLHFVLFFLEIMNMLWASWFKYAECSSVIWTIAWGSGHAHVITVSKNCCSVLDFSLQSLLSLDQQASFSVLSVQILLFLHCSALLTSLSHSLRGHACVKATFAIIVKWQQRAIFTGDVLAIFYAFIASSTTFPAFGKIAQKWAMFIYAFTLLHRAFVLIYFLYSIWPHESLLLAVVP